MKKEDAKNIIQQYQLIPGKIGRKILLAIENNIPINAVELPDGMSHEQLEQLQFEYKKKVKDLGSQHYPRNFIFYHLIKERFSNFSWEIQFDVNSSSVKINAPRIENLRLSLLSLLIGKAGLEEDTILHRRYPFVKNLPAQIIRIFSDVMEKMETIYPNDRMMKYIVEWIQKGLVGEELTVFSPICPDYSVEATGNPNCPFRHTFNELGSGLGLIAKRILAALPLFVKAMQACGIEIKIVIGLGDFEAYSHANLQRLNISREEFLDRVQKSKNAFEDAITSTADVRMITNLFGGYENWAEVYKAFLCRFKQNDFGMSHLSHEKLLTIVRKRKNLYDRWYGQKPLSEHIPQLLDQGAEYAALGFHLSRSTKNCLVLGADNDAMGHFYSVEQPTPTLYLKRFYC